MKKTKKLISLLLVFVMVVTAVPFAMISVGAASTRSESIGAEDPKCQTLALVESDTFSTIYWRGSDPTITAFRVFRQQKVNGKWEQSRIGVVRVRKGHKKNEIFKYTVPHPADSITLRYAVRAVDENNYEKYISKYNWSNTVTVSRTPQIIKFTSTKKGIEIAWKSHNANKYRVFYKNKKGGWSELATVSGNSFTDKDVRKDRTYTYTVRAFDGNINGINVYSSSYLSYSVKYSPGMTVKPQYQNMLF